MRASVSAPSSPQDRAMSPKSRCIVCKRPSRASSIYCSDACILKHAQDSLGTKNSPTKAADSQQKRKSDSRVIVFERKTGRLLAGPNAPTADNLKFWLQKNPTFEVVRPGTLHAIKPNLIKKKPPIDPKETKRILTTLNFERIPRKSAENNPFIKHPNVEARERAVARMLQSPKEEQRQSPLPRTPVQARPQPQDTPRPSTSTAKPASEPKKPARAVNRPHSTYDKGASVSPSTPRRKESPDTKKRMESIEPIRDNVRKALQEQMTIRMNETKGSRLSMEEIKEFAIDTEFELHELFKDVGMKYKVKYRSLIFNIKDRKNLSLWQKICERKLSPKQLVRLSPEELASQELAQWREEESKHQLELIKKSELDLLAASKTYVLKTHKGEEKWRYSAQNFYAAESIDPRVKEGAHKNADDVLFDMFKNEDADLLPVGKFLAALRTTGIRKTDPRIKEVMQKLYKAHKESNFEGGSPETLKLDRIKFKEVISPNIVFITRAFRSQFVIPDFQDFIKDIEEVYWAAKSNTGGKVASYIPQLARASADSWGVSVCTIDGQRFSIGDVNVPFTLQSCSKPLTYAMALETIGSDVVHNYVGTEPSGRNFNELVLDDNKKPHNPMINAGAILVCSLLKTLDKPEMTLAEKFDYVMSFFSRLAGNEVLGFNNAVFLSEREAADRNYALGFYMREYKCYPEKTNLRECMDFYFQCCSMEANCDIMSIMAATLANGGICPITDEKVLRPDSVRNVLSLMHSCGMYDYSGQFAFKVGLPAKSGVSGAMLIVVPNVMGICTWSPPLDPLGNSCRGLQFCDELVGRFNFHKYDNIFYASHKKDPRRYKFETTGLSIVNLLFSAASGDLSAMRRHHLSGMDMTLSDYDGRTALHLAAAEGHLACVEFLLSKCEVPHDPRDRWGSRPLNEAETFGHTDVVNYLKDWEKLHPEMPLSMEQAGSVDEILHMKRGANHSVKDSSIDEIVSGTIGDGSK